MNKPIDPYPGPKNRATAALLCWLAAVGLVGCAAKTAATANRDITTVIAGAGAAANQAEQEYTSKQLAQTATNRTMINDLGSAYEQARAAFIAVLTAESVYQGAEQLQIIACSPAGVKPANPPAINCAQTTQNARNAAAQLTTANSALDTAVSTLNTRTRMVQSLK